MKVTKDLATITVSMMDDHPVVLNGLEKMLQEKQTEFTIYDTCTQEEKLLTCLQIRQPDVLLLDIQMSGKQGDELANEISVLYPNVNILALTNMNQTFHVRNMFMNGAKGYLLKTTDPQTLYKAIKVVSSGEEFVDPSLRKQMLHDLLSNRASANGIPLLTKRETEVLTLIANEYTSKEIAQQLFISLSAVENHRLNLFFKLNVKNVVGLVKKALHLGLIKV